MSPLWNFIVVIMVITPVNKSDSTEGEGDECQCRCIILGSSYSSGRLKRLQTATRYTHIGSVLLGFVFSVLACSSHIVKLVGSGSMPLFDLGSFNCYLCTNFLQFSVYLNEQLQFENLYKVSSAIVMIRVKIV